MIIALIGLSGLRLSTVFAANEAAREETVLLANETRMDGDWAMLSPYGDFDNPVGMQRFQRADAEALVNEFNGLLSAPKRFIGLPWYIGHPDHPRFKDKYKDTRAYGRIKKLEAREEGLFANVKWSEAGKQLIESEAFHGHSVNWRVRQDGPVWRPVSLKSVGFTNEPNIPVPPVTAANEHDCMNKEQILAWLKSQGIELANEATPEQILAALSQLGARLQELPAANERVTKVSGDLQAALGNVTTLTSRVQTLETQFANERKARVALLIAGGLAAGKIVAAQKATWEQEFANEFDKTLQRLEATKPQIKMTSVTGHLSQQNKDTRSRIEQQQDAVNEFMAKHEVDYDTAFARVRKAQPALFEAANAGA